VALAELAGPAGAQCLDAVKQAVAARKLDRMPLAVVETEGLNPREAL
jgi:hypothetical protein